MIASADTLVLTESAAGDNEYIRLQQHIFRGWPDSAEEVAADLRPYLTFADEHSVSRGLVYKGHRLVVPGPARAEILHRLQSAHTGTNACLRRAPETVFWPGITADIKRLVGAGQTYNRYLESTQKEPLMSHITPNGPSEKVGVDVLTFADRNYLLIVDYLSGFFEVDRLPPKTVSDNTYCLRQHFASHGLPAEVKTDISPF